MNFHIEILVAMTTLGKCLSCWLAYRSLLLCPTYLYDGITSQHPLTENRDAITEKQHQNCYAMRTFANLYTMVTPTGRL
jgi:hypothetical protein